MIKTIKFIESVSGLSGFAIIWWQAGFWIAIAVFLLMTALYQKMELNLLRSKGL